MTDATRRTALDSSSCLAPTRSVDPCQRGNDHETGVDQDAALDEMVELVGEGDFDLYDGTDGIISNL